MTGPDPTEITAAFGKVLQHFRAASGLSQEDLADRAGVDRTFVSRLERGVRQPTITTLIALGTALGVSATNLVQETERLMQRS